MHAFEGKAVREGSEMTKRDKIVLGIIGAVLGVILGAMFMPTVKKLATQAGNYLLDGMVAVYRKATYVAPVYYELTDEEKEWLIYAYGHEDRISEGLLSEREAKRLKISREGLAVLEEKYPGYQFKVTRVAHYTEKTEFKVYEKNTGEIITMNVRGDDESGYEITDNFCGYFFEDKYGAYMEKIFMEKEINEVTVSTHLIGTQGREYDINMTVEDVVSGRLEIWASVSVFVYAKNMTETECTECAKRIQEIIEQTKFYGSYNVYFQDTTKKEMIATGEKGKDKYPEYDFRYTKE